MASESSGVSLKLPGSKNAESQAFTRLLRQLSSGTVQASREPSASPGTKRAGL